jgi:N4-gp56 family major capsid protein
MGVASNWVSQGSYLANPKLSRTTRHAAQAEMVFRQYADVQEEFGKGKGDTVNFDKWGNISTAGGTLVETATMPRRTHTPYKGTLTVNEYGNGHGYTGKLEALSQFDESQKINRILKNDMVETMDTAVEAQFTATKIVYVASSATAYNIYTDATPVQTASVALDAFHVKNMVDYLYQTMKAPKFSGGFYHGILSTQAARGLHDALQAIWQYTKYPVNGEIGSYYATRFSRSNHAISNAVGISAAFGEAYIFGADTVMEAIVIPEEIRYEVKDVGRDKMIAWYALLGFKIFWLSDPDNSIVKFGSA